MRLIILFCTVTLVILLVGPAVAKIRIADIEIIETTEDFVVVGNLVTAVANSMADIPRCITICIETWDSEICCRYLTAADDYECRYYRGEGVE